MCLYYNHLTSEFQAGWMAKWMRLRTLPRICFFDKGLILITFRLSANTHTLLSLKGFLPLVRYFEVCTSQNSASQQGLRWIRILPFLKRVENYNVVILKGEEKRTSSQTVQLERVHIDIEDLEIVSPKIIHVHPLLGCC